MYKSFYEQVFYEQGSTRVYENVFQVSEALQPYFKESKGIQGSAAAFFQDLLLKIFSYESFSARKKKSLVPTSYLQEEYKTRHQVFCPTICSIQGKRRIFMQRARYKGNIPCVINQEFLFLVHEYWGSEATHLG